MRGARTAAAVAAMVVMSVVAVAACPTGLNVIPTADVLEEGLLSVQLELTGRPNPIDGDRTWGLLTQFALAGGIEFGVDFEDPGGENEWSVDVKWQVLGDGDDGPAVALGLLDVNRGGERGYYVAGARSVADSGVRAHAGILHSDATTSAMIGVEVEIAPCTVVMLDWITGPDGQFGLGIEHALSDSHGVHIFFVTDNSAGGADTTGVNLCWEGPW